MVAGATAAARAAELFEAGTIGMPEARAAACTALHAVTLEDDDNREELSSAAARCRQHGR